LKTFVPSILWFGCPVTASFEWFSGRSARLHSAKGELRTSVTFQICISSYAEIIENERTGALVEILRLSADYALLHATAPVREPIRFSKLPWWKGRGTKNQAMRWIHDLAAGQIRVGQSCAFRT